MGALWGGATALAIGLAELFGRRIVHTAGALRVAATMQFVAVVAAVVSLAFIGGAFGWIDLAWGGLSGIGMGIGTVSYFEGLRRSTATVVSPVVAWMSTVIPYLYALTRGTQANSLAIVGAAVAFAGLVVLAGGTIDRVKLAAGLRWSVISGLSYGFGMSVFIEPTDASGAWPAISQRVGALAVVLVVLAARRLPVVLPAGTRSSAIAAGVAAGFSSIFLLLGLQVDEPSTLVAASMVPAVSVVVGYMMYGDPVSRRQVSGIALALAGITLVVIG